MDVFLNLLPPAFTLALARFGVTRLWEKSEAAGQTSQTGVGQKKIACEQPHLVFVTLCFRQPERRKVRDQRRHITGSKRSRYELWTEDVALVC